MAKPSKRQLDTLRCIAYYLSEHGLPPATRDLCAMLGVTNQAVADHLDALERKGFIARARTKSRAITILGAASQYVADFSGSTRQRIHVDLRPLRCSRCSCVTFAPDRPCFGCKLARRVA